MATKKQAKAKETSSVIDRDRAADYHVSDVRTESGRKSIDSNDVVAQQLRGKTHKELLAIAANAGIADAKKRWGHLNAGLFRMALGNVLRGLKSDKTKAKPAATKKATKKATKTATKKATKTAAPRKRASKAENDINAASSEATA